MMYVYEALVYPSDDRSRYEVYIPDWDAFTVGDDFKDAVYMAHDMLELAVAAALDEGSPLPEETFDHAAPQGARDRYRRRQACVRAGDHGRRTCV